MAFKPYDFFGKLEHNYLNPSVLCTKCQKPLTEYYGRYLPNDKQRVLDLHCGQCRESDSVSVVFGQSAPKPVKDASTAGT